MLLLLNMIMFDMHVLQLEDNFLVACVDLVGTPNHVHY